MVLIACKKDKTYVPNVPVNIIFSINSFEYKDLNAIGGFVYITGGYKGIIVSRSSQEDFKAYDRACTFHPQDDCARIEMESSGLIAIDSCCGSRYLISDGSVLKGPAQVAMKQYHCSFDGIYVRITN